MGKLLDITSHTHTERNKHEDTYLWTSKQYEEIKNLNTLREETNTVKNVYKLNQAEHHWKLEDY